MSMGKYHRPVGSVPGGERASQEQTSTSHISSVLSCVFLFLSITKIKHLLGNCRSPDVSNLLFELSSLTLKLTQGLATITDKEI